MKFFILIQIIALVGLSTQFNALSFQDDVVFPIKAVSIIRGEIKDPSTNSLRQVRGIVRFTQESRTSSVAITVDITGLPLHALNQVVRKGFHVHSFGISDYSDNITAVCGSVGPHFNPSNETHGYLDAKVRHDGDLGNLLVNPDGTIKVDLVDDRLSLCGLNSIIGRSLVLHGGEDDGGLMGTDMSRNFGSSGPRIACGVIGLEKSEGKTVARSLFSLITGEPLVRYFSLDEPSANATNITGLDSGDEDVSVDFDLDNLDELNQTFPQAVPIFKLFYKILKNVVDTTRESNLQLMSVLTQLPFNLDMTQTDSMTVTDSTPTPIPTGVSSDNTVGDSSRVVGLNDKPIF